MDNRSTIWAGLAGLGLALFCCGGPLLIGAISALSMSALVVWGGHIILPTASVAIVVAALALYARFRRFHAPGCCDARPGTPERNLL
jgi:hypothetical protein